MSDLFAMIVECALRQNQNVTLTAGEEDMCLVPRNGDPLPHNTSPILPVSDRGIEGHVPLTEDKPHGGSPIYGEGCGP